MRRRGSLLRSLAAVTSGMLRPCCAHAVHALAMLRSRRAPLTVFQPVALVVGGCGGAVAVVPSCAVHAHVALHTLARGAAGNGGWGGGGRPGRHVGRQAGNPGLPAWPGVRAPPRAVSCGVLRLCPPPLLSQCSLSLPFYSGRETPSPQDLEKLIFVLTLWWDGRCNCGTQCRSCCSAAERVTERALLTRWCSQPTRLCQ